MKKLSLYSFSIIFILIFNLSIAHAMSPVTVTPSAGGNGKGAISTPGGAWDDYFSGFRISVLDYSGEPAFTLARQKILCKRSSTKSNNGTKSTCIRGADTPCPTQSREDGWYARRLRRECHPDLSGILFQGGSASVPVREHDLQLTEHNIPILVSGMPMTSNSLGCQIQHSSQ